jgi:recombination protein RecA
MSNVTGYGAALQEKSGQALKYQSDVKLCAKKIEKWTTADDRTIGQMIEWECQNTALNIAPWGKAKGCLRYGHGIDNVQELANMCVDFGLVEKGGSWFTIPLLDNIKVQGIDNVREIIQKTEGAYDKLYAEVREILGIK